MIKCYCDYCNSEIDDNKVLFYKIMISTHVILKKHVCRKCYNIIHLNIQNHIEIMEEVNNKLIKDEKDEK
jgi:hypothetical protein